MNSASPLAFVVTVDRNLLGWVLVITFFFTLSIVAVFSRERKWYELFCLFFAVYTMAFGLASWVFGGALGIPFILVETVTVP
jgi:hypothetical protein